ncbi:MAG: hypothetical protein WHV44_17325 [Anaerolineales bacterium]
MRISAPRLLHLGVIGLLPILLTACAAPTAAPTPQPATSSQSVTLAPSPSPTDTPQPQFTPNPTQPPAPPHLTYPPTDIILDIAYSPTGDTLAVAAGLTVYLYDAATLNEQARIPFTAWVNRMAFHPTQPILATAAKDGRIQFWDSRAGAELCTFTAHPKGAIAVAFHPTLPLIGTTGNAITSKVWDISAVLAGGCDVTERGQLIGASYNATDFLFSPDGRFLALTDIETIRLRNSPDLTLIATLRTELPIYDLALSPDGRFLAAANRFSMVTLFDIHDPQKPIRSNLGEHTPKTFTWRVAFSPDGRWLAAGNNRGDLTVWDMTTRQPAGGFHLPNDVAALAFDPHGRWLLAGGTDAQIHFLDLETLP